jgi:thiol-disulfide isomerase/thioredoxin
MMRALSLVLIVPILVAFAGCGGNTSPLGTGAQAADAPAAKVELKTASWEQAVELVAKNKGKIVVLDVWSSSCPPCVREFPGLVKLQKDYPQDVVCISFNCDYIGLGKPEDDSEAVLKFLQQQKASIHNLLSSDEDQAVYKKAKISAPPAVQIFGRDGQLSKQFDDSQNYGADGFTYEKHVAPYVAELVKAK